VTNNSDNPLLEQFERTRATTLRLCRSLQPEDTVVQTMPDVSPTKWHLAHVTWFFERFVLEAFDDSYRRLSDDYHFLFNSYYQSAGQMHARDKRGLLARPTLAEVLDYRQHVDAAMSALLSGRGDDMELHDRTTLGLHHEQQHQELLLTDIKHVFSCNPLQPAVNAELKTAASTVPGDYRFADGVAGIQQVGASGDEFCFDNETPRHDALLHPHRIGTRLVTNQEYRGFIDDGGYRNPELWLADGWATINERGWTRPLYWDEDLESEFTLAGRRDIDAHAPVCHVSFYEADAFARWADARLPTEFEWEAAAAGQSVSGNFMESNYWQPIASDSSQLFGDVWEWTSSSYAPYPGFVPLAGSLGEYNGKFMCNQMTVRGGSCVTATDHIRSSYRSFFYPDARWQFLGIRLARDGFA
jgi:ergothioneine biosynthesis protein EgtB